MSQPYEVVPYSIDKLRALLAAKANTDLHTINTKRHVSYFEEYFTAIGARTIVVENNYTDRDYLEDFAGYYVRCFHDYPRICTRLHFFTESFSRGTFTTLLSGRKTRLTPKLLQEAYLGFIVVKPLPQTVIGRTCLVTYPKASRRYFPITRDYSAHLFGFSFTVKSLAFQEQDSVAAACATSALWSAFHGTGLQFQHPIPSPVEITRAATSHIRLDTRTFPASCGLTATQMADAIRSVGLEPYLVNASDEHNFRNTLYAYLRGQIPILLLIELFDPASPLNPVTNEPEPLGLHAVTVTGYSLGKPVPTAYAQSQFHLRALRMDKIYAHDDQIGPFARMELLQGAYLRTSWLDQTGSTELHAAAHAMLIPLYEKIRIPFETIFGIVSPFSSVIDALGRVGVPGLTAPIEWDVYLTNVNELKAEVLTAPGLSGEYRRHILTLPMPRFIWRATALVGGHPALDLLFDATDIEQGSSFVGVIKHNVGLGQVLRSVAQGLVQGQRTIGRPDRHVFDWLANSTF